MTTYHGLIKWRIAKSFLKTISGRYIDDVIRFSSLTIERPHGWTYAMTEIQLKNKFNRMVTESLGESVEILEVSVHTDNALTYMTEGV